MIWDSAKNDSQIVRNGRAISMAKGFPQKGPFRPRPSRRVELLLVFFSLLAVSGLKSWAQDTPPSTSPDEVIDQKSQSDLLQQTDELFQEVSRLRGLPILHPVKKAFENREFFRNYSLNQLNEEYPPEKKLGFEKAYQFFGLLPAGADIIQTFLDAYMKVVRGMYDPKTQTLYLANWVDPADQEKTLVHELVHALQDQTFGLQAYLDKGKGATLDEGFARAAVMEGEAVAITLNYTLEDKGSDFTHLVNIADWTQQSNMLEEEGKKAFGKRAVLNDVIDFPYVYGAGFLQKYVKVYGWDGMKYLFEHPPTCTQQIMHPEKFFPKRFRPIRIGLEDLSATCLPGTTKVWENTFGEYGWFTLLRQYLPETLARESVKGWRGDRIQVYETNNASRLVMAAYLLFDGEDSAKDFFANYRSLLEKKYDLEGSIRDDDSISWKSVKGFDAEVYVEWFGPRVVIVEGTPDGYTSKVRASLWDIEQVKPASK
jgi:hypothetical protein